MYQLESKIIRYFADLNELRTGTLSLAGSSYFCSFIFPNIIRYFNRVYPGIQCDLTEGNIEELKEGLIQGKFDLVLETGLKENEKIRNIFYQMEHIILAVPSSYPVNQQLRAYSISRKDIISRKFLNEAVLAVPLQQFRDVPFIKMKPGNDLYERATTICRDAGFVMKVSMSIDQVMTALNIASAGVGALFVRAELIKHFPRSDNLCFYKFDHPLSTRKINWAVKAGAYVSKAAQAFIKLANYANSNDEPGPLS